MIGKSEKRQGANRRLVRGGAAFALLLAGGVAVVAQVPGVQGAAALLEGLRGCRSIASVSDRAACYDDKVGALLGAVEAGEIRLVDQEEVRKTRRQLFGLTIPEIDMLKAEPKEEAALSDLFETTITSSRQTGPRTWRFTTAEGAVWEINSPPRKIDPIMPGDTVVFKKASLGYYFIRISGQIGVKGRRVM